jgi:DNA primase
VAASGRYIHPDAKPKARHGGAAKTGVFSTYGARSCELITLCEAPLDALTLAACGFSAVALNGCIMPEWLPAALAFKRVLIASDADEAGNKAAPEWTAKLQAFGARCARFTPYRAKDFNEALQRDGQSAAASYLTSRLAHIRAFEWRA